MNEKVLLIDDHGLFRAGLECLLTQRGIEIAAISSVEDVIRVAGEWLPDIVLFDIRMPNRGGLLLLSQLCKHHEALKVVILTTSTNDADVLEALRAGACGYLLKDIAPDELVLAIRDILAGKAVVAPELMSVLACFVRSDDEALHADKATMTNPFSALTPREYEILTLLAKGQSNKVIARHLGISDGTVKLHVKAILRKLNVSSRITAAVMAVEYDVRKNAKNGR